MIYALKEPDPEFQIYWANNYAASVGGVLGVRVGGKDYLGETLSAANGYSGTVKAVAGAYQILLDGAVVPGATEVSPSWPTGKFDILILNDSQPFDNLNSYGLIQAREPDAFMVCSQELFYLETDEGGGVMYPYTLNPVFNNASLDAATNQVEYNKWLDGDGGVGLREKYVNQENNHPDRQAFFARYPHFSQPDNHQMFGGLMFAADAVQPDDGQIGYDAVRQAYREFQRNGWGQPSGDVDTFPSGGLQYYSKEIGNLKLIWTDQNSYERLPLGGGDQELDDGDVNVSTVTRQVQWIKQELNNTACDFIVIFFTKPITGSMGSFVGGDATALAQHIDAASTKTIFFITGQTHAIWARTIKEDMTNRVLDLGISPCSPTNATAGFAEMPDDVFLFDRVHFGAKLAAEYDPNATPPADVQVQVDSTSYLEDTENDNTQQVFFGASGASGLIDSIDSPTQFSLVTPYTALGVIPIGTNIAYRAVHTTAHVTSNPNNRAIYYGKLTLDGANPIRIRVIEVYTGVVIWDQKIKAGERRPFSTARPSSSGL